MHFVVVTGRGETWDLTRSMREQDRWPEHAAFMNGLEAEGFIVLGGPVGDGSRVVLIVNAESEEAVRRRLAADPWAPLGFRPVISVEPWEVLLGELPE